MVSKLMHKLGNNFVKISTPVSNLCLVLCLMVGCCSRQESVIKPIIKNVVIIESESKSKSESETSIGGSTPSLLGNSVSGCVEIRLRKFPNTKPYKAIANVVVRAFQWRPPIIVSDIKSKKAKKDKEYVPSAWQIVGETTTNDSGYYFFENVITPGYSTFIEVASIHRPANPLFPKLSIIANPELSFANYGGGADKKCLIFNDRERAKEARSKNPKTCLYSGECDIDRNGNWWRGGYDPNSSYDGDCSDYDTKSTDDIYHRDKYIKGCEKIYEQCGCADTYEANIKNCLRKQPSKTELTFRDRIIYVIRKDIAGNDVALQLASMPVRFDTDPDPSTIAEAPKGNKDLSPKVDFTITDDDVDAGTKATEAAITSEDWYKSKGYFRLAYGYEFPKKHTIGTSVLAIMRLVNKIFIDNFDAATSKDSILMSENTSLDLHYFPDLNLNNQFEGDIDPNSVQKNKIFYPDDEMYNYRCAFLIPTMHLNRAYGYQYPKQLINLLCCSMEYGNARPFPGMDVSFCSDQYASCASRYTDFSGDEDNGYGQWLDWLS